MNQKLLKRHQINSFCWDYVLFTYMSGHWGQLITRHLTIHKFFFFFCAPSEDD
jgi:hypothetical protein